MCAQPKRSPILYVCAIGFAAWVGLFARQYALNHPSPAADCAGDTLWALAVFSAMGLLFPAIPTWQAASAAFMFPAMLKLGQLYHAPWLDAITGTQVGFLILGTDVVTTDLACYAGGAVLGMLTEIWLID